MRHLGARHERAATANSLSVCNLVHIALRRFFRGINAARGLFFIAEGGSRRKSKPMDDAAYCYEQAEQAQEEALRSRSESLRKYYAEAAARWVSLARSYDFVASLNGNGGFRN